MKTVTKFGRLGLDSKTAAKTPEELKDQTFSWVIIDDETRQPHFIENGQFLRIWEQGSGREVFSGKIHWDTKIGAVSGKQKVFGFHVLGIQSGMLPTDWALFFFRPEHSKTLQASVTFQQDDVKQVNKQEKESSKRWMSKKAFKTVRNLDKQRSKLERQEFKKSLKR